MKYHYVTYNKKVLGLLGYDRATSTLAVKINLPSSKDVEEQIQVMARILNLLELVQRHFKQQQLKPIYACIDMCIRIYIYVYMYIYGMGAQEFTTSK